MSLENIIIGTIAAIVGCVATIITAMIKNRRKEGGIEEEKIKTSIEAIIDELNIKNAHFYILNNSDKAPSGRAKVEFKTKYKFESKSTEMDSDQVYFYQITGRSGRLGVLITKEDCGELGVKLLKLGEYF